MASGRDGMDLPFYSKRRLGAYCRAKVEQKLFSLQSCFGVLDKSRKSAVIATTQNIRLVQIPITSRSSVQIWLRQLGRVVANEYGYGLRGFDLRRAFAALVGEMLGESTIVRKANRFQRRWTIIVDMESSNSLATRQSM